MGTGRYMASSAAMETALTWNWVYIRRERKRCPYTEKAVIEPAQRLNGRHLVSLTVRVEGSKHTSSKWHLRS